MTFNTYLQKKLFFNLLSLIVFIQLCKEISTQKYGSRNSKFVNSIKDFPEGDIDTQLLSCGIKNKELEKELLGSLPKEDSTSVLHIAITSHDLPDFVLSTICISISVKNSNKNLNTEHVGNGKCFANYRTNSEPFMIFYENNIVNENSKNYYRTRVFSQNNTKLFDMKLPPLTSPAYYHVSPKEEARITHFLNVRSKFDNNRIPYPYYQPYAKTVFTTFSNQYDSIYFYKIPNFDDIHISPQLGFDLGLLSSLTKDDLIEDSCVVNVFGKVKTFSKKFFYTTYEDSTKESSTKYSKYGGGVISDESISKYLPFPFTKLTPDNLKDLYTENEKVFNLNDEIINYYNYYNYYKKN